MKSQVSYKHRYALLTKGRRLIILKRSPIESSDLNDSYSEDNPVNYLLLCFFSLWQVDSPEVERILAILGKKLSKAGGFSEEYGMCSMALNMDSSGKLV